MGKIRFIIVVIAIIIAWTAYRTYYVLPRIDRIDVALFYGDAFAASSMVSEADLGDALSSTDSSERDMQRLLAHHDTLIASFDSLSQEAFTFSAPSHQIEYDRAMNRRGVWTLEKQLTDTLMDTASFSAGVSNRADGKAVWYSPYAEVLRYIAAREQIAEISLVGEDLRVRWNGDSARPTMPITLRLHSKNKTASVRMEQGGESVQAHEKEEGIFLLDYEPHRGAAKLFLTQDKKQ